MSGNFWTNRGMGDVEGKKETKSKTWETTVTRIPSWPDQARPLKQHDWMTTLFLLGDVILVLTPLYFFLLGIAAIILNGDSTTDNDFGTKVEFAIQLGPTIFPIVFAAISGRSMKMIARYLAEKGAKLSTLELLMASQSVWGTIESQLLMRRLTLVGANLLFLWAMSPLGGQASLRLLNKSNASNYSSTSLRYMSTGPGATAWAMAATYVDAADDRLTQVDPLYAATLLSSTKVKEGPQDTWGNVKIPCFECLNSSTPGSDGWVDVPKNSSSPASFYSLAGIPVVGLPSNKDLRFNLETSHLTLKCDAFEKKRFSDPFNMTELKQLVPGLMYSAAAENSTIMRSTFFLEMLTPFNVSSDGRIESFFGFVNHTLQNMPYQERKITYASLFEGFLNVANCSVGQTHVETEVQCYKEQCRAVRVRRSLSDRRYKEFTGLDHYMIGNILLQAFPASFAFTRGSTPTEQFIFNTSSFPFVSPMTNLDQNAGWVDVSLLGPEIFSRNLALVMNTYHQLSLAPNAYLGNLPTSNLSIYGPDTLPVSDIEAYLPGNLSALNATFFEWFSVFSTRVQGMGLVFIGAAANATLSTTQEIYICNFAWSGLLFVATGTIFITGVASLFLKRRTLGPEMFGFVSSMTYENPFVKIPNGGTMLDSMERSRLLKDLEVYIGDVHGNDDVGHIALAAGVPLRKLERGRLYS